MTDHLQILKDWAKPKGLDVRSTIGNQREPEHIVSVVSPGSPPPPLISRSSLDNIDTAAMYLLNTLERLGVDVRSPQ